MIKNVTVNNTLELLFLLDKDKFDRIDNKIKKSEVYTLNANSESNSFNENELLDQAQLTISTLDLAIEKSTNVFKIIKSKIKFGKNLEFIAEIITLMGTGVLFTTLSEIFGTAKSIGVVSGIVATISGIISIIINRGLGTGNYNSRNLIEDYHGINIYRIESGTILNKLKPAINNFDIKTSNIEKINQYITKADKLSEKLKNILPHYLQ